MSRQVSSRPLSQEGFLLELYTAPEFQALAKQRLMQGATLSAGAGGGVLLGFMAGGPIGAGIGGVVGFVSGMYVSKASHTDKTMLQLIQELDEEAKEELWKKVKTELARQGNILTSILLRINAEIVMQIVKQHLGARK